MQVASKDDAANLQRYFKTGPGEYGEGDKFIGVRVGPIRKLAKRYRALPLADVEQLLASAFHEERMLALLILIEQFGAADKSGKKAIYDIYLGSLERINNWDLVDVSSPRIVGAYLNQRSRYSSIRTDQILSHHSRSSYLPLGR